LKIYNEISKALKSCLKEKVSISAATVVGFLITGTVMMAAENVAIANSGAKDSFSILSVEEVDDVLDLTADSHIEGVIDLGEGQDIVNITGVGTTANPETLTLANVEKINITENSNIILSDETKLEMDSNSKISINDNSTLTNKGKIVATETKSYLIHPKNSTFINDGEINVKNSGAAVIAINKGEVINNNLINIEGGKSAWGLTANDESTATNNGTISISNTENGYAVGMMVRSGSTVKNEKNATIILENTANGIGINADTNQNGQSSYAANAENAGSIIGKNMKNGWGMLLEKGGEDDTTITAKNTGIIDLIGENVLGIEATAGNIVIENEGEISVSGKTAVGIKINSGNTLVNAGKIVATGENAYAIKGGDSFDKIILKDGSWIEGNVDLGKGKGSFIITEEGTTESPSNFTFKDVNVENVSEHVIQVTNSNVVFTEDTNLNLTGSEKYAQNIIAKNSTVTNKGRIVSEKGVYLLYSYDNSNIINDGTLEIAAGGTAIVIGGETSNAINNNLIKVTGSTGSRAMNIGNGATGINNGEIQADNGMGLFMYSGTAKNEKDGKIILTGEGAKGIRIYGSQTNGSDNPVVVKDSTAENNGTITGNGNKLYGMSVSKRDGAKTTIVNTGTIELTGDNVTGIYSDRLGESTSTEQDITISNTGTVEINGTNSTLIVANRANVTNDGILKLNIGTNGADNNKIYVGDDSSSMVHSGEIYLTDVTATNISDDEMTKLQNYIKTSLFEGKNVELKGDVVRNGAGQILFTGGEGVADLIPDLTINANGHYDLSDAQVQVVAEKGATVSTDRTFDFNGDNLSININASENLEADQYVVELNKNDKVEMTGKVVGQDLGFKLVNSNININGGKISTNVENKESIAVALEGSTLETNNATILGNILLNNESTAKIDAATANNFTDMIVGDGTTYNTVEMGTTGAVTTFSGTIKEIGNLGAVGTVVFNENAVLKNVSAVIDKNNLFVIRMDANQNNALSENNGEIILKEDGRLMVETDRLTIPVEGMTTQLGATVIKGENGESVDEKVVASQFIYDITLADSTAVAKAGEAPSTLQIGLKDIKNIDEIENEYEDIYVAAASSGNLSNLTSISNDSNKAELNKLFKEIRTQNAYVLGEAISVDSMKAWRTTLNGNVDFLNAGEFKVKGIAMGDITNNNFTRDYDFRATGLMFMGEYGYDSTTTIGMAAGGGYVYGKLSDAKHNKVSGDSWYVGAFGKKAIGDFTLTGNMAYQYNKLEGKRKLSNAYESFNFSDKFGVDGFNIGAEGRYDYKLEQGFVVTPHLSLNMNRVVQGKINEGNGTMAETLNKYNGTTLETKFGVELAKYMEIGNGAKVKLFGDLAYVNMAGDVNREFHGNFTGDTRRFNVDPIKKAKNTGELTVGGRATCTTGIFMDGKVSYGFGNGSDATKVTLGLGYTF
jgi:hypothetical protein